jgi:energy-coupling factor transport system substrate-specific component
MIKSYICLGGVLAVGAVAFLLPVFFPAFSGSSLSWGLAATLMVVLLILAMAFSFEASAMSSKEIALVAMLGTLSAIARVPFAAIPSVQPSTFLIICSGYVFGPLAGFMVGAVTALVSNFFLGQGPWTPYQMFAWGMVGIMAAGLKKLHASIIVLIIFGIVCGYLYGWTMNTWFWLSFSYPLTLRTFLVYQATSFWFDTLHALSNALLLGFLGLKTIRTLERFEKRFHMRPLAQIEPIAPDKRLLKIDHHR